VALNKRKLVDLHIPFAGVDEGVFLNNVGLVCSELLGVLSDRRGRGASEFTGEEFGPGEAVLSLRSGDVKGLLTAARTILEQHNLLKDAFALVREDSVSSRSDARVPLQDLDVWLGVLRQHALTKISPKKHRPKVGDYYAVPLLDGRFGYLQYVHRDRRWGDLVQVFSLITCKEPAALSDLCSASPMFPPVLTAVGVGVQVGGWRLIGSVRRTGEFRFPTFRATNSLLFRMHEPGVYDDWWLWSAGESQFVGRLTSEQRKLEYHLWWAPQELARRIATGENEYDRFL